MLQKIQQLIKTPSAETIALRELEQCKRTLLDAYSNREYAQAMCEYYETKIKRLNAYLHDATGGGVK